VFNLDVKRTMADRDITEIDSLLQAVSSHDQRKPLNDHLWLDLRQGGRSGFAGITARDAASHAPLAYCQISRGNDSWAIDLVVHPNSRDKILLFGQSLMTEAINIIKSEGGGHVHWWVSDPSTNHITLAKKMGFNTGRKLLQMRVALPLAEDVLAGGRQVETRSFRVGIDDDAWITVNNRAFSEHPEQGGWTREILRSRQSEKWFDPRGFLLYFLPGSEQLAAFCWTKIDREQDPRIGEIYVIAVDPSQHKKGLGRALTLAGLDHLAKSGATTGLLYVDKDNLAAIGTYEKIGFVTHNEEQAFVADIGA